MKKTKTDHGSVFVVAFDVIGWVGWPRVYHELSVSPSIALRFIDAIKPLDVYRMIALNK